jgi:glycosyltransferase involved in cell wall biosynthesis
MPRTVHGWRSKKLGDAAFDRSEWNSVIPLYEAALADDPHMVQVWTRLGRAQLEIGDAQAATRSFEQVATREPDDPESYRNLARAARARGDKVGKAANLLSAYERTPDDFSALTSFVGALPNDGADHGERAALLDRARRTAPFLPPDSIRASLLPADLMLDMTELMLWYQSFRLPSGVQRVQIGLIAALVSDPDVNAVACCFDGTGWKSIEPTILLHLLDLSQTGDDRDDPDWRNALLQVQLCLSGSELAQFAQTTVIASLGSWVTNQFMDAIDGVKRNTGAKYVPLIYDLIPFFRPDWFPPGVAEDFLRWLDRLALSADAYMTISESTKRDLIRLSAERGRVIDPKLVTVMALDADYRSRLATDDAPERVQRYGLSARGYVLFVATIEPRKNHANALRAWRTLIERRGADVVPDLVFVGHRGWKNDEVHQLLEKDKTLRSRVKMLSGVPDDDLSALYANARFILYPSFYEGWGLPVTEALCHGRAAVVARNSSLTEAGGSFVDYFDAGDVDELVAVAGRLVDDDAYLAEREQHIATAFSPRTWRQLGADLEQAAACARARPNEMH